jgi:hypothetical protein
MLAAPSRNSSEPRRPNRSQWLSGLRGAARGITMLQRKNPFENVAFFGFVLPKRSVFNLGLQTAGLLPFSRVKRSYRGFASGERSPLIPLYR